MLCFFLQWGQAPRIASGLSFGTAECLAPHSRTLLRVSSHGGENIQNTALPLLRVFEQDYGRDAKRADLDATTRSTAQAL